MPINVNDFFAITNTWRDAMINFPMSDEERKLMDEFDRCFGVNGTVSEIQWSEINDPTNFNPATQQRTERG